LESVNLLAEKLQADVNCSFFWVCEFGFGFVLYMVYVNKID